MARPLGFYSFMVLAAAVTMLVCSVGVSADGGCSGDVQGLITQCGLYVQKGPVLAEPSGGCCTAVKAVDIPCICRKISKDVEIFVDMDKVFRVARLCGRPIARGNKCGSSMAP